MSMVSYTVRVDGMTGNRSRPVPQPRSTYAPKGHHRCDKCGKLVRDGAKCSCELYVMEKSHRVVYHVDTATIAPPSNDRVPQWKAEAEERRRRDREQRDRREERQRQGRRSAHRRRVKERKAPAVETASCECCGAIFERQVRRNPSTVCPKCRKLPKHRRPGADPSLKPPKKPYDKEAQYAHMRATQAQEVGATCVECGTEFTKRRGQTRLVRCPECRARWNAGKEARRKR